MTGAWLLVGLMVVGSCTDDDAGESSSSSTPAPTEPVGDGDGEPASPGASSAPGSDLEVLPDVEGPAWEPATRTDELLAEIGASEDGPTVQHLVDAFALLVDDMPGATPTDLPSGDGIGSTYTLRAIDARRGELTDEQVAVLDDYLELGTLVGTISADGNVEVSPEFGGDDPRDPLTTTSSVAGLRSPRSSDDPPVEVGVPVELEYLVLLDEVRADWKEHAPTLPEHEVELYITPKAGVWMDATWRPDPLGGVCSIRVHAEFFQLIPSADMVRDVFAHEVFHCMQFDWWTDIDPPPWVVEGSADFAAADLYRSRHSGIRVFEPDWFTSADKALANRSYDAWPFFENVRLSGRPVYATIRGMFEEPQPSVGAYLAAHQLDGDLFRKDWSSRSLRTPSMGELWHLAWPSTDEDVGPVDNGFAVGERGLGVYNINGAGNFTHVQLVVTMTSDVGIVTVTPTGSPLTTYTAIGTQTVGDGSTRSFCFSPDDCACPSGQSSGATPMLGDDMVFSFAASLMVKHAAVRAEAWDPDERCHDEKSSSTATSDGDPHLVSFDGLPFDILTLGEFVLARDPIGDLEVQTRHEPIGFGTGTTAVAIGTGDGHRITFTRADFGSVGDLVVRVDGAAAPGADFSLGDVRVTVSGSDAEVTWPDGSRVDLDWFSGWFLRLTVPPERAARMEGLVGSSDGDLGNDLQLPDGTTLDTTDVEADESPYSLAWAVDDDTTLFDYGPGQSVATFRRPHPIPVPPAIEAPVRERCVDELGPRAAAHEVDACAYDVSATGDDGFVGQYVEVVDRRVRTTGAVVVPDGPSPAVEPGVRAAGRAGEPTLTLGPEQLSGSVTAVEGTVLLVRAASCDPDAGTRVVGELDVRVERVDDRDLVALAALCDPTGLASIGLGGGAERIDGEAYVWLPGSGDYEVTVEQSAGTPGAVGTIHVYIDPTPTVVRSADLVATDRRVLEGIGDTVVYLPDPGTRFDADGLERVCAVEVYWLSDEFPDDEPFDLESCGHPATIGSPGSRLVPVVVFSRSEEPNTIEVRPRG